MNVQVLDATNKSLEVVMSGAAGATNPSFTAAWADDTGSALTEGATVGALNGTTPVTLVAAPAALTRRVIKTITICNIDNAPVTLTISYNNNTTLRTIAKVTLAIGDTWSNDGSFDTSGNFKSINASTVVNLTVGTSLVTSGTSTRILYDNAGVLGEYTLTGSGTVVAMATAPTFVTSITSPAVLATSNDSGALGAAGTAFSDLFLAEGGVINWDSGDATLTQTGNVVALAGADLRVATADVGTNADTVPTLTSTNTLTNKTLTAPTVNAATLTGVIGLSAAGTFQLAVPTSDNTCTGPTTNSFVSGYTSSAIGDLVYLDSSAKWQKADADAASTATNLLGIALAVAATDAALLVALPGSMVYCTAFPTLTIGAQYFVGESAGTIQAAIPTGADNVIRCVGFGIHADKLFFMPSSDNQTTVA